MATMTNCPHCAKLVDPQLDNCPYCGGFLRARQPQAAEQRAQSQTCTACGALVQPGDIICVACGTNLLTGQRVAEDRRVAKPPRTFSINWTIVGLVAAGLVLLAILIAAFALMARDPVAQAMRLANEGNTSRAVVVLEEYVSRNPNNIRALEELGKLYFKSERYNDAASVLERVSSLEPTRRDAALLAVASLASIYGPRDFGREAVLLERIVQNFPADAESWFLLALARGAQGDVDGQIAALESAVALDPGHPDALQAMGTALALKGRHEDARRHLRAVITTDPMNGDALVAMGIVNVRSREFDPAVENLRSALASDTSIAGQAHLQLGLLLVQEGQFREAYDHFSAVLQSDRNHSAARFFAAVCVSEQGLGDEALREFEEISRGGGEYAARAAVESARIYLARRDADLAQSAIDRAEQTGISGAAYLTVKGQVRAMEGEDLAAQDLFRRALTIDPNYGPAYLENGLAFVRRGLVREGIAALNRYLELADPGQPGARVSEVQTLVDQLRSTLGERT